MYIIRATLSWSYNDKQRASDRVFLLYYEADNNGEHETMRLETSCYMRLDPLNDAAIHSSKIISIENWLKESRRLELGMESLCTGEQIWFCEIRCYFGNYNHYSACFDSKVGNHFTVTNFFFIQGLIASTFRFRLFDGLDFQLSICISQMKSLLIHPWDSGSFCYLVVIHVSSRSVKDHAKTSILKCDASQNRIPLLRLQRWLL